MYCVLYTVYLVIIKLHLTVQSDPVLLIVVLLLYSHPPLGEGINVCIIVCIIVYIILCTGKII